MCVCVCVYVCVYVCISIKDSESISFFLTKQDCKKFLEKKVGENELVVVTGQYKLP